MVSVAGALDTAGVPLPKASAFTFEVLKQQLPVKNSNSRFGGLFLHDIISFPHCDLKQPLESCHLLATDLMLCDNSVSVMLQKL